MIDFLSVCKHELSVHRLRIPDLGIILKIVRSVKALEWNYAEMDRLDDLE